MDPFSSFFVWEEWVHLNAANTVAILDFESHVTFLAPGAGPGVLHDPVFLASIASVTNDKGGVVELSTAGGTVEDSATVLLEDRLVSFDQDRGGCLSDSGLHLGNVVLNDI